MFFGSVSGGLSAELTGGNFWQGAATGLVVSGLNHSLHKMQEKKFIYNAEQHLDEAGYDPYGKPEKTTGYANNMLKRVKTLKNMEARAGKTIRVTEINNNDRYHGAHLGNGNLALSKASNFTFKSNLTLYIVSPPKTPTV